MLNYSTYFQKMQILSSLKIILSDYPSVKSLYNAIKEQWQENKEVFSYSQFTRYIKGEISIPSAKEDLFIRFIYNKLNVAVHLIVPNLDIDLSAQPLRINTSRLVSNPELLNLLAFHIINQEHLNGKFNAILTHAEAIPFAIAFSQILQIPWYSISFRVPPVDPRKIKRYPYLIDQELVSIAFFSNEFELRNKRILIISDYIRRGGFIDILFKVAEDSGTTIGFLISVIGIGTAWKRFHKELEGNIRVLHFL